MGSTERRDDEDLARNAGLFAAAVGLARARADAGRRRSALEWCRVAASFAMTNATGFLRSPELEAVLDDVAGDALTPLTPDPRTGRLRVLHVVSEADLIGGLTRLVERWIRWDADAASSVVVTRQATVLSALTDAAAASGGRAWALGPDLGDGLRRASRLRALAADADLVVCHLHSDDLVPALAFGAGYRGAPVALFNHADHLFWVAPSGTALIVDSRDAGATLTVQARGYRPEATFRMPLPVPAGVASADRDAVRDRLGTGSAVVAVTVARAVKHRDTALRPRFTDLAARVLEDNPRLVLVAVGPTAGDPPWPRLLARYRGRVHVVGPVARPQEYLAAADLYLDTFPFSSITSLLEAAAAGLPTVTLDAHRGYRQALGLAHCVAEPADRPTDVERYARHVTALVEDPDYRAERGRQARAAHLAMADDGVWRQRRRDLYETLLTGARPAAGPAITSAGDPARLHDYGLALLAIEQRVPLLHTVSGCLPRFDARDRRELALRRALTRVARKAAGVLGADPARTDALLVPRPRAAHAQRATTSRLEALHG